MCSTSLIIREYISKPQLDTTLYLLEWLSSKRQEVTNVGEDVEKREPSFTVGWGVQIWDTAIMETDSMEAPQKIKRHFLLRRKVLAKLFQFSSVT